jgi:hypothetical protein
VDNSNLAHARKLTDDERTDRLRLIRSDNVGPFYHCLRTGARHRSGGAPRKP